MFEWFNYFTLLYCSLRVVVHLDKFKGALRFGLTFMSWKFLLVHGHNVLERVVNKSLIFFCFYFYFFLEIVSLIAMIGGILLDFHFYYLQF